MNQFFLAVMVVALVVQVTGLVMTSIYGHWKLHEVTKKPVPTTGVPLFNWGTVVALVAGLLGVLFGYR